MDDVISDSSIAPAAQQLNWLRACYFFFFAILGIMVPYLGVFFQSRGFNPQEIGLLLAILMGTRIIAPNVWARVADRTGMRVELVKLGAAAAMLSYTSFFVDGSFVYLAVSLMIYTFFWNAILAQLEVITLDTLGENATRYGAIRSWGSVGYICLVVGGGVAVQYIGPQVVPYLGMLLFIGMLLSSLPLKAARRPAAAPAGQKLWQPAIIWFFISAMLLQMSAGPFYGFFVLYLKQYGYSESLAGVLVALGVVAEIIMFMFAPRLLQRFGAMPLMVLSLCLTVVRWLMMAYGVEHLLLIGISQLLHAFTFGLVHAASIQFVHQHFDRDHQSQGQALYASLGFGLGGALGIWICGYLWGDGSGAVWTWVFAAGCAMLSMFAVLAIPGSAAQCRRLFRRQAVAPL
ncbi:MFS transporter [Shewanella sp. NFH-SH190041]|uniref:MFS transporter n=1 Tax=Shewanella sp. NFH-SH190041 TaxID=2950245 RepID=UPI0021C3FD4F|nr:MFS transporter [Shewanella sp. NFH-SH190041]BDM63871.1 MFS transporter [Shewanella sp. NFH-SH190041]